MATATFEERLARIQSISLLAGSHTAPQKKTDLEMCVMEAVSFVAGERWTDSPECACPVISSFLRAWNDALQTNEERDRLLKPLVPRMVGTRNKALEEKRMLMAADWLVRVNASAWLRLAGLTVHADALAALPEITGFAQIPSIRGPIEAARADAAAAGDAAWDAARAAAGDAAWAAAWDAAGDAARAAAGDAARAAAGDAAGAAARAAAGDAAWAAAWDAAWDAARAAAGDAAWAAAGDAAWEKLKPTVQELQRSALTLVERMIALTEEQ